MLLYHVSSRRNRDSIAEHGLDSRRMGAARGIAGSESREQDGVFLARDLGEAEWFVQINNRRDGALDVWEVRLDSDVDRDRWEPPADAPYLRIDGFICWREPITPDRLRLLERDS
jgi:hypothetical protein